MASVKVLDVAGKSKGSVDLDDGVFGIQPNVPVMHQVVTAQLAARRAGTHSTLTRAEVRGGGRKPFKQKGTGNARAGLDPLPALGGRRRRARPQAPQLRPAHPEEDGAPGPPLRALGPGVRRQGAGRGRLGLGDAPHQGRRRRAGGPEARRPGARGAAAFRGSRCSQLPQPASGAGPRGRRAQRLRRPLQRRGRLLEGDAARGRAHRQDGPPPGGRRGSPRRGRRGRHGR